MNIYSLALLIVKMTAKRRKRTHTSVSGSVLSHLLSLLHCDSLVGLHSALSASSYQNGVKLRIYAEVLAESSEALRDSEVSGILPQHSLVGTHLTTVKSAHSLMF